MLFATSPMFREAIVEFSRLQQPGHLGLHCKLSDCQTATAFGCSICVILDFLYFLLITVISTVFVFLFQRIRHMNQQPVS